MKTKILQPEFVKFVPERIDEGVFYISVEYCTATHLCVCGCGNKVVTPLTPTDWELTFDGETVSLSPSIGNWNFKCQSHYWLKRGKILWAEPWSKETIEKGRRKDRISKAAHLNQVHEYSKRVIERETRNEQKPARGFWQKLVQKLRL